MKNVLTGTLFLGIAFLIAPPKILFAQGAWQFKMSVTDAGSPKTSTSESGTASANNVGSFPVSGSGGSSQATTGSQTSASASATGNGPSNTTPSAQGNYGTTVTYAWAGTGPQTSYFYLDITPSASASWQQMLDPGTAGASGTATSQANTSPVTVQAMVTASREGSSPPPANPGTTHFRFSTGNSLNPTLDLLSYSNASSYIYGGTGTVTSQTSAKITVGVNPSAN